MEKVSKSHSRLEVVLESVGTDKLAVVKLIKELFDVSLKEAKEIADSAPTIIKKGCSEEKAVSLKAELEEVGAEVKIMGI